MVRAFTSAILVLICLSGFGQFRPGRSFVFKQTAAASSTLNDSLISYWKLDETSGTRVDSEPTGTAQNLTDNNTVGYTNGVISNAADFELANTETLTRSDSEDLSTGNTSFSVSGWFKKESQSANKSLIGRFGTSAATREYLIRVNGGTEVLDVLMQENGGSLKTVSCTNFGATSQDVWMFFAVIYNSSAQTLSVSINNGTPNTLSNVTATADTAETTYIGGRASSSDYHDGLIDEVGFWKKVLSASEITELYNSGAGKTCCPF